MLAQSSSVRCSSHNDIPLGSLEFHALRRWVHMSPSPDELDGSSSPCSSEIMSSSEMVSSPVSTRLCPLEAHASAAEAPASSHALRLFFGGHSELFLFLFFLPRSLQQLSLPAALRSLGELKLLRATSRDFLGDASDTDLVVRLLGQLPAFATHLCEPWLGYGSSAPRPTVLFTLDISPLS